MSTLFFFALTLGVLIVVHEYGHFRVARACGVKVLRFSVGFGGVVWRRQAHPGATEFVLSAIPLGGYVRMLDEREAPVASADLHMAFNRKPLWQRTAVVAAGPIANLALAVLLYACVHWIGVQEPKALLGTPPAGSMAERAGLRAGDWVQAISSDGASWRVIDAMPDLRWELTQSTLKSEIVTLRVTDEKGASERQVTLDLSELGAQAVGPDLIRRIGTGAPFREPIIVEVKAGGAGDRGGLLAGDRVLSINDVTIADASQLLQSIRSNVGPAEGQAMRWRVDRKGQTLELVVTPAIVGEGSQAIGRVDAVIGGPADMLEVRHGLWQGLYQAAVRTWEMSLVTLKMFGKMLTGDASLKNLSGPLTIAEAAGQSAQMGLTYYLAFLAVVSVSLGVLNLLPLPMLDGGHLMYYLFEAVTGRPVSEIWLDRLQRGGLAIVIMMMSLAIFNDVARLTGLH